MHFMRNLMNFKIFEFFAIFDGFESFPGSNSNSWRDFLPRAGLKSIWYGISLKFKFFCSYGAHVATLIH